MRTYTFRYDVVASLTIIVDDESSADAMDRAQVEAQALAASAMDISTESATMIISVPDGVQPSSVIVS